MPSEIYLVKVGMTMTEGNIEEWYVEDGASVSEGEMLYRLETEKVNMDVDAESNGTVKHIQPEGTTCEPGDVIGYIYAPDEQIPDALPVPEKRTADEVSVTRAPESRPRERAIEAGLRVTASPAARRLAQELGVDLAGIDGTGPRGRITEDDVRSAQAATSSAAKRIAASPSARRRAEELGVNLAELTGTGPRGRITKEDVEAAMQRLPAAESGEIIAVRGMRKTIAQRMHESLQTAAQLTMDMEVCMDAAVALRERLVAEWEADGVRPTYTDLVMASVAKALGEHPLINSEFRGTEIVLKNEINVGMAVALDEGLVVPVIHNTDQLSLRGLARESSRLASAARDGTLRLDDVSGGTFTVTALGMFGVDSFTPILNLPQAGILGINRIYDGLGWEGDTPVRRKMMRLSLTWDHRALDGAPAATFLQRACELLEKTEFSIP